MPATGEPVADPATAPYQHKRVTVTLNPDKVKLQVAKAMDQYVDVVPTGPDVTMVVHASDAAWMAKAGLIVEASEA